MDLRKFLKKNPDPDGSTSSEIQPASAAIAKEADSSGTSLVESEPDNPCKKSKIELVKESKKRMTFNPRLSLDFPWVRYDSVSDGAFCKICEKWGRPPPCHIINPLIF